MKIRNLFLLAGMAVIMAGCDKDKEVDNIPIPAINVETSSFVLSANADSHATVNFDCNVAWTTTIEYDGDDTGWIILTPHQGKAGDAREIMITADGNTREEVRRATVMINYGDKTHEIAVSQKAFSTEINCGTTLCAFTETAGSKTVDFTINTSWTTSVEYDGTAADWLSIAPASGNAGTRSISITATANEKSVVRTATVNINYSGKFYDITVTQAAFIPEFITETSSVVLTALAGSNRVVEFSTNADWTTNVVYDGAIAGWLTIYPESGSAGTTRSINIMAAENTEDVVRTATVKIVYAGQVHDIAVTQKVFEVIKVTEIIIDRTSAIIAPGGSLQLAVTGILPSDANDKSVTWSSSNSDVAAVDAATGLVTVPTAAAAAATATITATANGGNNVTATCTVTVGGVIINGVTWATSNVDAPGTFAATPMDYGMLYQWNRNRAWPGAVPSPTDGWDTTGATGDSWSSENDPCPAGWRVANDTDYARLIDAGKVDRIQKTEGTLKYHAFTDKESGNVVIFPYVARIFANGTTFTAANTSGNYWSANKNPDNASNAQRLVCAGGSVAVNGGGNRAEGYGVRCVVAE